MSDPALVPFPFPMATAPMPQPALDQMKLLATPRPPLGLSFYLMPASEGTALMVQVYPAQGLPNRPDEPFLAFLAFTDRPNDLYVLMTEAVTKTTVQEAIRSMGPYRLKVSPNAEPTKVHRYIHCAVELARRACEIFKTWTPPPIDVGDDVLLQIDNPHLAET